MSPGIRFFSSHVSQIQRGCEQRGETFYDRNFLTKGQHLGCAASETVVLCRRFRLPYGVNLETAGAKIS